MAVHQFQTEVNKLLGLIIHSLYSHKEIFLRELVSNSSDALDKLKFLTVSDDAYKSVAFDPRIDISFDDDSSKLTVADTGIGMNETDLVENLGTIARSGTKAFLEKLADDKKKDSNLIGQFGVGFYSAFMIADKIEVISRKAGEEKAWKWVSDGKGSYETEPAERAGHGTTIVMHLNDEGKEFTSRWRIEDLVKKYSNHIAFPIFLRYKKEWDDEGKKLDTPEETVEQVNSASALWKRPKSELEEKDYDEFYQAIAHGDEDPLFHIHTKAEGTQEYATLFFVPRKAPPDLFRADYKPGVKLYVKRVFITDDDKELLPPYLRFVKGVIDSEDLPLNVSREILQQNKVLHHIRQASVKKILGEISALSVNDPEKFKTFVGEFNRPMKEGLYSDFANKETILEIVRFKSTLADGWTSLADYVGRMKEDQKAIYYITGDDENRLRASPLLELYRSKGIEVLVMDDEIDEFVIPMAGKYKDKEFKPVNRAGAEEEISGEAGQKAKDHETESKDILEKVKAALGDRVKDVKFSKRLTDSPSCIVADANDQTYQMQALLKAMGQPGGEDVKPILELNGDHPLVSRLKAESAKDAIDDISVVLFDQALMVEGVPLKDTADFVRRMNRLIK